MGNETRRDRARVRETVAVARLPTAGRRAAVVERERSAQVRLSGVHPLQDAAAARRGRPRSGPARTDAGSHRRAQLRRAAGTGRSRNGPPQPQAGASASAAATDPPSGNGSKPRYAQPKPRVDHSAIREHPAGGVSSIGHGLPPAEAVTRSDVRASTRSRRPLIRPASGVLLPLAALRTVLGEFCPGARTRSAWMHFVGR